MKDLETKKKLLMQMAKLQYRFDKKTLMDGKHRIQTQEQLAQKYKALIEKEVMKDEI